MLNWSLYRDHFSCQEMRQLWSEESTINSWLEAEQAIAEGQAKLDLIPREVSSVLSEIRVSDLDLDRLAEDMAVAGRPIVGLVKQMRELVRDDLARYVHFGATTQDIMDTGMVLQIRSSIKEVNAYLDNIFEHINSLEAEYGDVSTIGRTNGQYALPITFGQKLCVWREELQRRQIAIHDAGQRGLLVQLGGPVGNLASFGDRGVELKQVVANHLDLGLAAPHWQNARDGIAEIVQMVGLLCSSLAKIAHNINILSSSDIGELYETPENGKGASSSMAHKKNQRCSEFAEAVARLGRQQAEKINEVSMHEHERSGGVWIAEWVIVPQAFLFCSGALLWTERLFKTLKVDTERMELNLNNAQELLK